MKILKYFPLTLSLVMLFLLCACASAEQVKPDPTALPYSPITIEPLEIARGDPKAGQALFATYCGGCHSIEETVELAGPTLFKAGSRLTFKYIKNSLENPHEEKSNPDSLEYMPEGIADQLAGDEFYDVIAYVRTLK